MTKLPNIIAPKLLKKQVNSDSDKQSFFNKPVTYGSDTMIGLAKLINKKKINILNIDSLNPSDVKKFSMALHIKAIGSKSTVRLRDEIKFICKLYAAGQGTQLK